MTMQVQAASILENKISKRDNAFQYKKGLNKQKKQTMISKNPW